MRRQIYHSPRVVLMASAGKRFSRMVENVGRVRREYGVRGFVRGLVRKVSCAKTIHIRRTPTKVQNAHKGSMPNG